MRKIILMLPLILAGCSGMGCLEKVLVTEVTITKAYETNYKLVTSDMIDIETSKKAKLATDTANIAADAAGNLCATDELQALDYLKEAGIALNSANTILGELDD